MRIRNVDKRHTSDWGWLNIAVFPCPSQNPCLPVPAIVVTCPFYVLKTRVSLNIALMATLGRNLSNNMPIILSYINITSKFIHCDSSRIAERSIGPSFINSRQLAITCKCGDTSWNKLLINILVICYPYLPLSLVLSYYCNNQQQKSSFPFWNKWVDKEHEASSMQTRVYFVFELYYQQKFSLLNLKNIISFNIWMNFIIPPFFITLILLSLSETYTQLSFGLKVIPQGVFNTCPLCPFSFLPMIFTIYYLIN